MKQQRRFLLSLLMGAGCIAALVPCLSSVADQGAATDSGERLPSYALRRLGSSKFLPATAESHRIVYSPDGKFVASLVLQEIGAVYLGMDVWERQTGQNVTPARLRGVDVTGVSWAPDGRHFVTSHRPFNEVTGKKELTGLHVWTVGEDHSTQLRDFDASCFSVSWSPTKDQIAACVWESKEIVVLDRQGQILHKLPFSGTERSGKYGIQLDYSPDGKQLAVSSDLGVCLYHTDTGQLMRRIPISKQAGTILAVRLLAQPGLLAVATDRGLHLHRLSEPDSEVKVLGEKAIVNVSLSHDQQWIATSGFGKTSIWDLKTGHLAKELSHPTWCATFSPSAPELAMGYERVYFLRGGTWDASLDDEEHHYQLVSHVISGDRLWTGEVGPTVREWDFQRGVALRSFRRSQGSSLALAKVDDKYLAVAGGVPQIEIRSLETGKIDFELPGHAVMTMSLAYSAKHRRLLSAGADSMVRAWNLETRQLDYEFPFIEQPKQNERLELALAPSDDFFICSNSRKGEQRAYSAATGKELWKSTSGDWQSISLPVDFTPDSRRVLSVVYSVDKQVQKVYSLVRTLDSQSGTELSRLDCHSLWVMALAVSPDGRHVAISGLKEGTVDDKQVEIWSLRTGKPVAVFSGFKKNIRSLCFSPDGNQLITLSSDSIATVWDVKSAIQQRAGIRR